MCFFVNKVKELRNHGDEAARILQAHLQDGVEPPVGLARHFEDFMRMVCVSLILLIRSGPTILLCCVDIVLSFKGSSGMLTIRL